MTPSGQYQKRMRELALQEFVINDLEKHSCCSADVVATHLETEARLSARWLSSIYLHIGRRHAFDVGKISEVLKRRRDLFHEHPDDTFSLR